MRNFLNLRRLTARKRKYWPERPTLGELFHAHFDCPEFSEYERGSEVRKEATSTCLEDGKTVIVSPHTIYFDQYAEPKPFGRYIADGGKRTDLQVGEDGYVTKLDPFTGLPLELTKRKETSREVFDKPIKFRAFGDGFYSTVNHTGALLVATVYLGSGPDEEIYIDLSNQPSGIGGTAKNRFCRRAQFDQAAYETFQREHQSFAALIDSMSLDQLKDTVRTNPDFARRYDEHMTMWQTLRTELK